jgi:hypothetical protein
LRRPPPPVTCVTELTNRPRDLDAKPGGYLSRAADMVRLVALVALVLLVLLVSVSAGPAAQPLDEDHLEGLRSARRPWQRSRRHTAAPWAGWDGMSWCLPASATVSLAASCSPWVHASLRHPPTSMRPCRDDEQGHRLRGGGALAR